MIQVLACFLNIYYIYIYVCVCVFTPALQQLKQFPQRIYRITAAKQYPLANF